MSFLVASSVGPRSRHRLWLSGPEPPLFDLWLVDYTPEGKTALCGAQRWLRHPGGKWPNLARLFSEHPRAMSSYRAVFCPDDDLELDASSINRLFRLQQEHQLALAQPAFTWDSAVRWPITRQRPFLELRYTNFVENGATLFSAEALTRLQATFPLSQSGFGLDLLWPCLLDYPARGVAIVDGVPCRHPAGPSALDAWLPRPAHRQEGERLLAGRAIRSVAEHAFLLNSHGLRMQDEGFQPDRVRRLAERTLNWVLAQSPRPPRRADPASSAEPVAGGPE